MYIIICICIYIYTYTYTYVYAYICIYIYWTVCLYVYIYIHIYMSVLLYVYTHIHIYIYMYTYICMHSKYILYTYMVHISLSLNLSSPLSPSMWARRTINKHSTDTHELVEGAQESQFCQHVLLVAVLYACNFSQTNVMNLCRRHGRGRVVPKAQCIHF